MSPGSYWDGGLRHDGAGVHLGSYEMHGAAGDGDAFIQNASVGVQTLERRQEGRVDVEMTVPPAPHEAFGMEAHEAGIAEKLHACLS